MSAPRPRTRASPSASEWPRLSLLTVYSDQPLLAAAQRDVRLDDAALEAARVLYFNTPLEDEAVDATRRNRIMGTVTGVQGFARTLAPPGSQALRAVHSTKRRMVWSEVEPGFFVHATVQLPRPARRSRSASLATAESRTSGPSPPPPVQVEDEYLIAALHQSHRRFRLRHGTIMQLFQRQGKAALLERMAAHWDHWLRCFDVLSHHRIEQVLDAVPHSSLLTPTTTSQLRPLLVQFAASNTSALPILLHGQDVLALPTFPDAARLATNEPGRPPPPHLHEDELVDLVRYLADLVPKSTVLAVHNDSPMSETANPTSSSVVSNAWSSSLSTLANGMSFLAPRPLSLSLAAVPSAGDPRDTKPSKNLRAGFAALRQQEKAALAEPGRGHANAPPDRTPSPRSRADDDETKASNAGWSFRNVSWGKLGFGGNPTVSTAKTAAELASDIAGTAARGDAAPTLDNARPAEERTELVAASETPTADSPSTDTETAPLQVELAPTVDTEDLAAAIGATPEEEDRQLQLVKVKDEANRLGQVSANVPREAGADDEPEESRLKVLEIYAGGAEPSRCQLRRYTRGLLTLALAVLPSTDEAATAWLDSRAERLLEAVETMTELVQPPKAVYPHRHIVKEGPMVASVTPSSASDAAHAAADESECDAALLDSYRSLHSSPSVLESITRLSSTRWALHRQRPSVAATPSVSVPRTRDVYAVAPSRNTRGRELSLVDAADELRRIERAYEKW
ncbi:hypothetical protein JCM3774_003299 [Rhodotorula dairenensis]